MLIVLALHAQVLAQSPVRETGFQPNRDYLALQPFESIDTASGNVVLTFTDLALPGNAGRQLRFERTFNNQVTDRSYLQWRFGIAGVPMQVSQSPIPANAQIVDATPDGNRFWTPSFPLSDGSTVATTFVNDPDPSDPSTIRWVSTPTFWKYDRDSRRLYFPDGLVAQYDADGHLVQTSDVFGNTVTLTRAPGLLTVVQSVGTPTSPTQARTVVIEMDDATALPTKMTYQGKAWQYTYPPDRPEYLTDVLLPDLTSWHFDYEFPAAISSRIGGVTTPQGGHVSYTYEDQWFQYGPGPTEREQVGVLSTRSVTGVSQPWRFEYPNLAEMIVTLPSGGRVAYAYISSFDAFTLAGGWQLFSRRVYDTDGTTELEREVREYTALRAARPNRDWFVPALQTRTITRNGGLYVTTNTYAVTDPATFANFHRPVQVTETGQRSRTTTLTYRHFTGLSPYLVGLPATEATMVGAETFSRSWTYHDTTGFRTSETADGITAAFAPDAFGNVQTITKANGKATTFAYNWGTPSAIVTGEYPTTRIVNEDGTIASEKPGDRDDLKTSYAYDPLFRFKTTTPPGSVNPITTTYDASTVTVDRGAEPQRSSVVTTLDGFGRPTATTNAAGVQTCAQYDGEGRVTFESYPFAAPTICATAPGTTTSYDGLGRVRQRTNRDGSYTAYAHTGNTVAVTEVKTLTPLDTRTETYVYESFGDPDDGRLVQVTDAKSHVWRYSYNGLGQLTRVAGPPGPNGEAIDRTWNYGMQNGIWVLRSETHPESGTTAYTYDAAGVLQSKTTASGTPDAVQLTYGYDGNDRVTTITSGDRLTRLTYEPGTDQVKTAQVQRGTILDVDTEFQFESGRLIGRTDRIDGIRFHSDFRYDGNDDLASIRYPSGRLVGYTYAAEHHLDRVYDAGTGPNGPTYARGFAYHPSGAIRQYTAGNGMITYNEYDATRYWPSRLRARTSETNVLLDLTYGGYDRVGNVGQIVDARGVTESFTYDALDRLETIGAPGRYAPQTLTYDGHGNRTDSGMQYHPGTLRLATASAIPHQYLANGNLTQRGPDRFSYTPSNMIDTAIVSGTTTTYRYDAEDGRVKKTDGQTSTYYIRGPRGELLAEMTRTGPSTWQATDYLYSGQRLLAAASQTFDFTSAGGSSAVAPGAPRNLAARVFDDSITVTWQPPLTGGVETYIVQTGSTPGASDLPAATISGTITTSTRSGVAPGTYYLRVRAENTAGTGDASNEVTATVGAGGACSNGPGAPTSLSATVNGRALTMTWSAPAGCPVTSYVVEAGSAPGLSDVVVPFDTDSTATSYHVDTLPIGTYYARVRGRNAAGIGPASNDIIVVISNTSCLPGTPTNLSGTLNDTAVTLTWTAPGSGCGPITSYFIEVGSTSSASDLAAQDTGSVATSVTVNDVRAGLYYVRVRAHNAAGNGPASNEINGRICNAQPMAPTDLSATLDGNDVTFTWGSPSGQCATSYRLEPGPTAGGQPFTPVETSSSALTFTRPNVPAGLYHVQVRALNRMGSSDPSNQFSGVVPCMVAPLAPTSLSATRTGSSVTLSWIAPAGGTCPATSYVVEVGSASGLRDQFNQNTGSAATSITRDNVPPGRYYARVLGKNGSWTSPPSSEYTNTVPCTTVPGPPTGLDGRVSGSTVTLWWTAPETSCPATSYVVEAGTAPGAADIRLTPTNDTTLTAYDVPAGRYYARVRAANANGSGAASNEVTDVVHPPPCTQPPSAPTGLSYSPSGSSVTLSWSPGASGCAVTSYVIAVGSTSGGEQFGRIDVGTATSYTHGALPVGTYYARVYAHNASGDSAASNEITGTVDPPPPSSPPPASTPPPCAAPPDAPTGLAGGVSGSTVTLWWAAPAGGCPVSSYVVEAGTAPGAANLTTTVTGATSLTVSNVPPGQYYARVRAQNGNGTGPASNEVTGSVQSSPPLSCNAPPSPPSGLGYTASGTAVTLWWTPPSDGCDATSYVIEVGTTSGGQDLVRLDVGAATTYTYGSLPPGTYYVRVRAHNAYGDSGASNEISGTVQPAACTGAPGAPGGLDGAVSGTTVTVWWAAPTTGCAVSSYVVEVGSAAGWSNVLTQDTASTATSFSVSNVAPGTYYVRVRARNADGDSGASNEISGTVGP